MLDADHQLLVTVPALLGVGRALQVSLSGPSEAFGKLFDDTPSCEGEGLPQDTPSSEGEAWGLDQESTINLFKMVRVEGRWLSVQLSVKICSNLMVYYSHTFNSSRSLR